MQPQPAEEPEFRRISWVEARRAISPARTDAEEAVLELLIKRAMPAIIAIADRGGRAYSEFLATFEAMRLEAQERMGRDAASQPAMEDYGDDEQDVPTCRSDEIAWNAFLEAVDEYLDPRLSSNTAMRSRKFMRGFEEIQKQHKMNTDSIDSTFAAIVPSARRGR